MSIKKFEDLDVWRKAIKLDTSIYKLIHEKVSLSRDFALKTQMNRSSGSIADNIAEGFERDGTKEFLQFLHISKGSAGELRSQLYRSFQRGHLSKDELDVQISQALEISRCLGGLIQYLKSSNIKGRKYDSRNLKSET